MSEKPIDKLLKTMRSQAEQRRNDWLLVYQNHKTFFPEISASAKVLADRACGELEALDTLFKLLGLEKTPRGDGNGL